MQFLPKIYKHTACNKKIVKVTNLLVTTVERKYRKFSQLVLQNTYTTL